MDVEDVINIIKNKLGSDIAAELVVQLRFLFQLDGISDLISTKNYDPVFLLKKVFKDNNMSLRAISLEEANDLVESYKTFQREYPDKFTSWLNIKNRLAVISKLPINISTVVNDAKEMLVACKNIREYLLRYPILAEEYEKVRFEIQRLSLFEIIAMEDSAKDFFIPLFEKNGCSNINIQFNLKEEGVRPGCQMVLSYNDQDNQSKMRRVFIKANEIDEKPDSNIPIEMPQSKNILFNIKEMFVYKVLEYMGLGPTAYFFFNANLYGDMYIATYDISFSNENSKETTFEMYSLIEDKLVEESKPLDNINRAIELTKIYLFSQLFRLKDTLHNPKNFGRIVHDGVEKWKIVDFDFKFTKAYELSEMYCGFHTKNEMFDYSGYLANTLRKEEDSIRMKIAVQAFHDFSITNNNKLALPDAAKQAFKDVTSALNHYSLATNTTIPSSIIDDFNSYKEATENNYSNAKLNFDSYLNKHNTNSDLDKTRSSLPPNYFFSKTATPRSSEASPNTPVSGKLSNTPTPPSEEDEVKHRNNPSKSGNITD